jgi:hypothetical protein
VVRQRDSAVAALSTEAEAHASTIAKNEVLLSNIRKAIVDRLGGMGNGSAIWSNGQWDKGWVAGITSALDAFDATIKSS